MIGTTLAHYKITAALGAGGMGEVYRATDTNLGREVAIKVLPTEVAQDAERLARFKREAHLLAALNHPNIAAIYGLEEADGKPFLALELVEGEDLKERLARGAIPVDEVLEIAEQIAEALEEAHNHGIVHRDLKPANVKITPEGKVKVLDFGLAKAWAGDTKEGTSSASMSQSPTLAHSGTAAGIILGTAAYMSPEQASGGKIMVSNRTDVYALGATIYALLAARPPFEGGGQYEIVKKVLESDPPSLKEVAPEAPLDLQTICEKCLSKRPQDRYHSAKDVADDLQRYLDGYPISARPIGPLQRIASWCRRNPAIASLIGGVWAALIVGAMVSTYFWFQAEVSAEEKSEFADKLKGNLSGTFEVVDDKLSGDDPVSQSARHALLEYQKKRGMNWQVLPR